MTLGAVWYLEGEQNVPVCKLPLRSFGLAFHQFPVSMTDWDLLKDFLLVPLGALLVDVFLPRCYLANSSKRTVLTWYILGI